MGSPIAIEVECMELTYRSNTSEGIGVTHYSHSSRSGPVPCVVVAVLNIGNAGKTIKELFKGFSRHPIVDAAMNRSLYRGK